MNYKLEVCCGDLTSVVAAREGGADRVELCEHLELDGLTPNAQLIRDAVATGIRVHVLIRPRSGNFVYTDAEVCQMEASIRDAIQLGAKAVVIGALTPEGDIDIPTCQRLVSVAHATSASVEITFHRAFDVCRDPFVALSQISGLGCDRLLTSGQQPTAIQGISLLRQLVDRSATLPHPVTILAGSGVTADNIRELVLASGVKEVHGSLRSNVDGIKVTTCENVMCAIQNLLV